MSDRAEASEATFFEASEAASLNGLRLLNPSDGCYQLRQHPTGYIINIYPRRNGANGRVYHDPNHPGPLLPLPRHWTLLDVVLAAIRIKNNQPAPAEARLPNDPRPRIARNKT